MTTRTCTPSRRAGSVAKRWLMSAAIALAVALGVTLLQALESHDPAAGINGSPSWPPVPHQPAGLDRP